MLRRGMTLIELLIVLAILAGVSGMVVAMTGQIDEDARYQETQRRLDAIRRAILGPDSDGSGALPAAGFIHDVGRLPTAAGELLTAPAGATGWRGPYLSTLPARREEPASGSPTYYDDWGQDLVFAIAGDALAVTCAGTGQRPSLHIAADAWRIAALTGRTVRIANRSGLDLSSSPRLVRIGLWGWQSGSWQQLAGTSVDATLGLGPDGEAVVDLPDAADLVAPRLQLRLIDPGTGAAFPDIDACIDLPLRPAPTLRLNLARRLP